MTVPDELRHELWAAFCGGEDLRDITFNGVGDGHWTAGVDRMLAVLEQRHAERVPGVAYTDRAGLVTYLLDRDEVPVLPRPERDVAVALLRFALERLEGEAS